MCFDITNGTPIVKVTFSGINTCLIEAADVAIPLAESNQSIWYLASCLIITTYYKAQNQFTEVLSQWGLAPGLLP